MKHQLIFVATAAVAAFAAHAGYAAHPSVSNVSISQDAFTRTVTVNYTLSGAPAIITLDITTNSVSIGQQNVWAIAGDANKVVEPGNRSMEWHPDKSWPNQKLNARVRAVVTAWATNDPPMYLAADLVSGDVKYYTCAEAVPGGVQDLLYKTTSLLMRRIYARGRAFMMGSPTDEPGYFGVREAQHEVSFSHDYYIGVYEVTQQQWAQLWPNSWPSLHSNKTYRATRPVENIAYWQIRGETLNTQAPGGSSFLGRLRGKFDNAFAFDLPGAAQWEYACRAGNGNYKYGDGTVISSSLVSSADYEDAAFNEIARNAYNNAMGNYSYDYPSGLATGAANWNVDATCGTAIVGSYRPNSWGLYDMHGNVWEICLDFFAGNDSNPYQETPTPTTSWSNNHPLKGGSYQRGPWRHRASFQMGWDNNSGEDRGIRVALTLD